MFSSMSMASPSSRSRTCLSVAVLASLMLCPLAMAQSSTPMSDIGPRIVGGVDVSDGQNPFVVALHDSGNRFTCGASLVAPTLLMTAAHCIGPVNINGTAVAGRTVMSNSRTGKVYRFRSIFVHPRYGSPAESANDLAFIELAQPVVGIRPIAITQYQGIDDMAGLEVTVSGWGATSEGGRGSDRLQEVAVNVDAAAECARAYQGGFDRATMFCASRLRKDSCQGDSGGPIFIKADGTDATLQVGVVSWGLGCARNGYPGVYTRLDSKSLWDGLGNSAGAQRVRALLGR